VKLNWKRAAVALVVVASMGASGQSITPKNAVPRKDETWWKHALIYEIYPRSFQDSNGDGVGDLNGITQRLDYLQKLGVDAIWIAPMYPSPQVDFGYDVSDYENVDPQYGTLKDFDRLEHEAEKRHIRIVLDMVLNHTSDKHAWFVQSASSQTNAKADWYVWNDGVSPGDVGVTAFQKRYVHTGPKGDVVPPNNWESYFGGSAWEWVPARGQFYYHKFYKQQPDLNWRNPAVERAMFAAMRFWLDRGVAGFRLDAITTLYEDPQLRSEKELDGTNAQGDPRLVDDKTSNLPEEHDVIRRMRQMVEKYPGNRVLIGETYLGNTHQLDEWYGGAKQDELQLPMDMFLGFGPGVKLSAEYFRRYISEAATELHGGQPLFVFDNHDNRRSIDRFGGGVHDIAIAKILATILLTTRATALTYYGAEIGMRTNTPTRKEDVKDPIGITGWPKEKGRDGERTPMQWTPGPQAGFSTNAQMWLPVAPDYTTVNVQTESGEPGSLLEWNEKLTALRRSNAALHDGELTMLDAGTNVLAYVRRVAGAQPVMVVMNINAAETTVPVNGTAKTLAASDAGVRVENGKVVLPAYASWVAEVR